jgi:hypothetical protein
MPPLVMIFWLRVLTPYSPAIPHDNIITDDRSTTCSAPCLYVPFLFDKSQVETTTQGNVAGEGECLPRPGELGTSYIPPSDAEFLSKR